MKIKVIIDDNIIIDEEVSDKCTNFAINEGDFKLEYLKSSDKDIEITSKPVSRSELRELMKDSPLWDDSKNSNVNKDKRKRRNGVGVKAEMERYSKPVNDKKKSKEAANMSGKELENLFSDLFVEEKPKPILDEDEIDKITEILEEKFKNQ